MTKEHAVLYMSKSYAQSDVCSISVPTFLFKRTNHDFQNTCILSKVSLSYDHIYKTHTLCTENTT